MRKGIIVGILAGVLISAGGAVAATHYVISNVRQITPKVRRELEGNRGRQGFRGPRGATGPAGPRGATGATGATGTFSSASVNSWDGPDIFVLPGDTATSYAICGPGQVLIGGGFAGGVNPPTFAGVTSDGPNGSSEWVVSIHSNLSSSSSTIYDFAAEAICAG